MEHADSIEHEIAEEYAENSTESIELDIVQDLTDNRTESIEIEIAEEFAEDHPDPIVIEFEDGNTKNTLTVSPACIIKSTLQKMRPIATMMGKLGLPTLASCSTLK